MSGIVDFHNHLIPGVDDGAQTADDSITALRAMVEHGVTHVITTPHFDGTLTVAPHGAETGAGARLRELDEGWARLQEITRGFPQITVMRGAEIMLDTPTPDLSDVRLHLDGGQFVLVEFPFMTVPPESSRVLSYLRAQGITPIIAHPERYNGVFPGSTLPVEWKQAGALLQLNGGSMVGRYGKGPKALGYDLLTRGLIDYMSSDYHTRGSPLIRDYYLWMEEHGAGDQAQLLMMVNPGRMLRGEMPLPVMPLQATTTGWSRLLPWKRG